MMSDQTIPAGVLLSCVTCTARILVLSRAASASAILCCRQPMRVVPPLWCGAVDRASSPKNLVAGRLYEDRVSGLRIRCTQSSPGQVTADGRALTPLTDAMISYARDRTRPHDVRDNSRHRRSAVLGS